jgi:serine/threonine-protein kinase
VDDAIMAVDAPRSLVGVMSTVLAVTERAAVELADTRVAPTPRLGESERAAPELGRTRFELLGVLGEGGMGHVERVRDRDLLRDVAVKTLRAELADSAAMALQFLWEARVTAYLDHPNIVPVHDLGATDGRLYFVMKLARGQTLAACLKSIRGSAQAAAQWTVPRRLRLFLQLCNAVSFAHSRGVLHRDLKPDNVLLGDHGEVIVTDWGLAVPLGDERGAELQRIIPDGLAELSAGTPMYMAPEQIEGAALDERSDVYTLGVILYEMVALVTPYQADDVPRLLEQVLRGDAPPLSSPGVALPAGLAAVVRQAMSRDRSKRYGSVAALSRDIETVLDGRTPEADHVSFATKLARYYVAHDPAMARLRMFDLDLLGFAGVLIGVGAGAYIASWIGHFGWVPLVGGLVAFGIVTVRWLRQRRAQRG